MGLILRTTGAVVLSGLFSIGFMPWIEIQWALLSDRLWLQPAIFGIGLVIASIAVIAIHAVRRGAR